MVLTLLRHTRVDVAPGTCYGVSDVALAASFVREVDALLPGLPEVDLVLTSPLSRCRRLAERIATHVIRPLSEDDRIREMDFGRWEGRLWNEIPRAEIDAWAADFLHARPHGGESVAMLRARALDALRDHRNNDGHTLIVTHAGVIKAALAAEETAAGYAMGIDFGGFVTLIY
ncbi:alpha-ribazole phosphatase [Henriciella litoralis]|uniref:alpha-ribazole phosphatase n=1 Tax=Henriciella litoralis TaxID=568102 RepID=UPI0009FCB0F4|nr:alpha-ribazole phosphatase [Henriciella litoralis]